MKLTHVKCSLLHIFCLILLFGCRQNIDLPSGDKDNGGLYLPDGFEGLVVADSIGQARHLTVSEEGNIYVKLTSTKKDSGNVVLGDFEKGKATNIQYFGDYPAEEGYGPTSMRIYNNYLYYGAKHAVYKQKLTPGKLVPESETELVLYNYDTVEHLAKVITFDSDDNMYVNYGSLSNNCQEENRIPGSPGIYPCPELTQHAGIWKFDATKINQTQKDGSRYATGLRDGIAMDWNHTSNSLFVVQHGRDDLHKLWPTEYSEWESALLPAEEFFEVNEGMNGGWPYFYFNQIKGERVQSPEYQHVDLTGLIDSLTEPLMGFPGHWAPNDLLFYTGDQFPEHYKNGAFIAFHGGGGRAPFPLSGFIICFVPFENGLPSGEWEVFADGFAGQDTIKSISDAEHRPMGLAMGPDGSLYVSDSVIGKIWRIMYKGNKSKFGVEHLVRMKERKEEVVHIKTPDEIKDNLEIDIDINKNLYNTYCASCHQRDGKGIDGRYPPLSPSDWVTGDNERLINVVLRGLTGPIKVNGIDFTGQMPKQDFLSDDEIAKILNYIRKKFNDNTETIHEYEVGHLRDKYNNG